MSTSGDTQIECCVPYPSLFSGASTDLCLPAFTLLLQELWTVCRPSPPHKPECLPILPTSAACHGPWPHQSQLGPNASPLLSRAVSPGASLCSVRRAWRARWSHEPGRELQLLPGLARTRREQCYQLRKV